MSRICIPIALLFSLICTISVFGSDRPQYTCYRLAKAPVIDGDLADWPKLPVIFLGRQDQVSSGDWKGPDDTHAAIRLGWDDKGLYFAIDVTDNEVIQNLPDASAEGIWSQDSIQWAIDMSGTGTTGYDGDDYEYGFGQTAGGPCVYRWHVSSSALVPGRTEQVPLAVRKTDRGVIYEALVPWEQVISLRTTPGQKIGFTILVQDLDTGGKKTIEWTPGISAGKAPGQFGYVVFSGAAAGEGEKNVFIAGQTVLSADPVKFQIISDGSAGVERVAWRVTDARGKTAASGIRDIAPFEINLNPKKLKPGSYTLSADVTIKNSDKPASASMTLERVDVEAISGFREKIKTQTTSLAKSIAQARTRKIETAYAEAALAVAELFAPFIDEDLQKDRKNLALRNVMVISESLDRQIRSLDRQMQNGPDERLRVPRPDILKIQSKDGEFYVGDEPVMLVGVSAWQWDFYRDREKFARLGYNTVRANVEPLAFFNDKGEIPADFAWWSVTQPVETLRSMNVAAGITAHASQIHSVMAKKYPTVTTDIRRKEFSNYLNTLINEQVGKSKIFYYTVATEGQRPVPNPQEHLNEYRAWLKSEYGSIDKYNRVCRTTFTDFSQIDFPGDKEKNPARRYDRITFPKKLVGDELAWCAREVKRYDPNALVGGYISYLMMDDEADYEGPLDPELDIQAYDVCDGDTAGNFTSRQYAMNTIQWLAMFRDLFAAFGRGKPQFDGEYHFANERRAYPDGWVPAIYFQGYVHGLSGTHAWVWVRTDTVDSAILLDARVAMELSETALNLRRLARPLVAFHKEPPRLAILYSHASTPAAPVPTKKAHPGDFGREVSTHLRQMKTVYEGLFFDGVKQGFITERQIEQGGLDPYKLLVVPAADYVSDKVVDQVRQFAARGGTVLLVGNCFGFDHRSQPRSVKPDAKGIIALNSFGRPQAAREKLLPYLKNLGLTAPVTVTTDGADHPTVEWQYAKDKSGEYLFLLNIGHKPATVNITRAGNPITGTDLITGKTVPATEQLKSLDVRLVILAKQ